jgi:DNA-directed RNA polymerase specialized sigma24 family protein
MTTQRSADSPPFATGEQPRAADDVRQLCRRHAGWLLSIAWVILADIDVASEIVSDTLAAAGRAAEDALPHERGEREYLVRSVYRRCLHRLVLQERFLLPAPKPRLTDIAPVSLSALAALDTQQRALVALTVFGRRDLAQTATILNLSPAAVIDRLRDALAGLTSAAAVCGSRAAEHQVLQES